MRPKHLTTLFFFILLVVFKKDSNAPMASIIDLELNFSDINVLEAPWGIKDDSNPKATCDLILMNHTEVVSSTVHTNIICITD